VLNHFSVRSKLEEEYRFGAHFFLCGGASKKGCSVRGGKGCVCVSHVAFGMQFVHVQMNVPERPKEVFDESFEGFDSFEVVWYSWVVDNDVF
jgi:hypothetical protein